MYQIVIILSITILAGFLRFFQLDKFPVQLNHDEVSQLYDGISIAQTGKDIYGNFLPVVIESVHDFKSPFYTYAAALTYLFFGNSELTIKIPGALAGTLMVPAVYFLVSQLFKNNLIALLASLMTMIAPFEIFFSRKSFENVPGVLLMVIGFSLLLKTLEKREGWWLYGGVLFLGAAMYTYFSHAIIIPLLVIAYGCIYWQRLKTNFLRPLILFLMLVIPIIALTTLNPGLRYRSQTVFITQDPKLGERLSQVGDFKKPLVIADYAASRYLNQFDPIYLFGNGLDLTNQGPLGVGPLLFIQLPLVILGIFYLIRVKNFSEEKRFISAWILLGMLPSGLTFEPHSPHRVMMVFTMLNVISAVGLFWIIKLNNRFSHVRKFVTFGVHLSIGLLILLNVVYFIHIYYVNYPREKSQHLHYPFKQVAQFAWSQRDHYDQIIFDPKFGEVAPVIGTAAHYYLAYYGNFPPVKMQEQYRRGEKPREVLFDKFSIRAFNWREDYALKNTLVIASVWSLPAEVVSSDRVIKVFNFYNGKPAFYAVKL